MSVSNNPDAPITQIHYIFLINIVNILIYKLYFEYILIKSISIKLFLIIYKFCKKPSWMKS